MGARSNDESTWSGFDDAIENTDKTDGVGYFFKPPYIGIDIDDVGEEIDRYLNGDTDDNIISEFVDTLCSYAEISPSGTGIHIIVKGELPEKGRKKGNVEFYTKGRFFTMTGNHIGGYNHVADDEMNVIERLHDKYIGVKETNFDEVKNQFTGVGNDLTEDEVVEKGKSSKTGKKFELLYNGDWQEAYPTELFPNISQSEADLAFSNQLAFYTGNDYEKMDSIFRKSGLYRPKWDVIHDGDNTYGYMTLTKAISSTKEVWARPQVTSIEEGKGFVLIPEEKKKVENKFYSYDDTGNGERFHDEWESIVRFNHNRNKWVIYDRGKWQVDEQENSRVLSNILLKRMVYEPLNHSDGLDEEAEKARSKHMKYSRSTRGKDNMLKEAQTLLRVASEDFDKDDDLLNVKNGYIDLKTGTLHDHDKDKFFLNMANAEYSSKLDHPLWDDFLDTIFNGDKDLINYVQRAIGYSISGETIEEKMFILHGNGRNGKSVFLNVITKMLGDYTMNIDADTLMAKKTDASGPSGHIARLQNVRFVTSSEPNQGNRFDEGQIKTMTGTGDKITARFMRSEPFDFLPKFKIWLATNYKPKISGNDDGIWRRFSVIPFAVQIPLDKIDKRLSEKLFGEMTGIMKWAVEGHKQWRKHGLAEPKVVTDQLESYRKEMDPIEFFISERCVREEGAFETSENLFNAYNSWAIESNEYRMKKHEFYAEISKKFKSGRNKDQTRRGRIGLKINDNPHEQYNNVVKLDFNNTFNG